MAIPEYVKKNFMTLLRAVANDDACLVEVTDNTTGKIEVMICARWLDADDPTFVRFAPFAVMCSDEDPYERYTPPPGTQVIESDEQADTDDDKAVT